MLGRVIIVVNPGDSDEVRAHAGGASLAVLRAEVKLRTGNDASTLAFALLDTSGQLWRRVRFGSKVRCYVDGTLAFAGVVGTPRRDAHGAVGVLVEADAVGRKHVLYTETVTADKSYLNQDTAVIGKDVIDNHFGGVINTGDASKFASASGVVLSSFEVTEGEIVGDVLQRLTRQDGHEVDVDELDDAHYYQVSTTPQATIREADLRGEPGERMVEAGVQPPRNVVRIKGGSGYMERTLQERREAWHDLNASQRRACQFFKAVTDRLSGVDLHLDRTTGLNEPSGLNAAIYPACHNAEDDATQTFTHTGTLLGTGWVDTANAHDNDEGTWARFSETQTQALNARPVIEYDFGTARRVLGVRIRVEQDGVATAVPVDVDYWDGAAWVTAGSGTAKADRMYLIWTTSASTSQSRARWRVRLSWPGDQVNDHMFVYEVEVLRAGYNAARSNRPASAGGDANADAHKVEFSDLTVSAGTHVPYPPEWTFPTPVYAQPKLRLTVGDAYALVLKDAGATASKYWRAGYASGGADPYADGHLVTSADDGLSWTALGHDLTFRWYWSQDTVDVVRTRAKSRLSAAMTAGQTTVPVDELRDFAAAADPLADRTLTIGDEDITYTGKSATSGPGDLTGAARGANDTTPAAHATGDVVAAMSVRDYGTWPYSDSDTTITTVADAERVADVILTQHRDPTTRLTLPLVDARPALTPRSVVTVHRPQLDVAEDHEVAEVRHVLDETGDLHTVLVTGALEYNAARAITALRRKVT